MFGCGSNAKFQLGLGELRDFPEIVELSNVCPTSLVFPVLQVACCSNSSLLVDARRKLYGVGENGNGQLSFKVEQHIVSGQPARRMGMPGTAMIFLTPYR